MSAVILLSSSPPRIFARSPTPADTSSPNLPSASALLKDDSPGRNRFKKSSAQRDGFLPGFSSARQVLAVKDGAENQIITSPARNKFKSHHLMDKIETVDLIGKKQTSSHGSSSGKGQHNKPDIENVDDLTETASEMVDEPVIIQIAQKDVRRNRKRAQSPLMIQKAIARKTDWTPPKPMNGTTIVDDHSAEPSVFPTGLLGSFGYEGVPQLDIEYTVNVENPTKRQKVEMVEKGMKETNKKIPTPSTRTSNAPKPVMKRTKSPTKKALTITGLATSNFRDNEEPSTTSMMQYLTQSSQVTQNGNADNSTLETKVQKTKAAVKRLRDSKKGSVKSRLVSPSTAMRSLEQQETIFGSASQLVREESPSLLRDTIEAIRESESSFFSDQISPPRPTQTISAEVTPLSGTSRFRRFKGLWTAAGRDDDNALLHVDTVDLTDTPGIRTAFSGKDVMVQPAMTRSLSPTKGDVSLHDGTSSLLKTNSSVFLDIDEVIIPGRSPILQQTRGICTTTRTQSPPRSKLVGTTVTQEASVVAEPSQARAPKAIPPKKRVPKKPHYAGFTVHELQKQISAYGFKAVKKREKMVELLERCWQEKHGAVEELPVEPLSEAPGPEYGDILSNVHDISARPVPKVKKPRAPRKKKEVSEKDTPAKKPRQRKKKDAEDTVVDDNAPKKAVRKRKPKASTLSKVCITPADEMDDATRLELETIDATATPITKLKVKAKNSAKKVKQPVAPPATLPFNTTLHPIPISEDSAGPSANLPLPESQTRSTLLTSNPITPTSTPSDLQSQITKAIYHPTTSSASNTAKPYRNHNLHPTWHEKILLYDPIILEDLALWLNTEGLGAIGEDREVSALEVRTWCESRGICCLWKGGWRGNKGAASAATGGD